MPSLGCALPSPGGSRSSFGVRLPREVQGPPSGRRRSPRQETGLCRFPRQDARLPRQDLRFSRQDLRLPRLRGRVGDLKKMAPQTRLSPSVTGEGLGT